MDGPFVRHGRSVPCDHLVQVYREPFELAEAVATFLAAGLEAGEPAVVVATRAHRPLFDERLARRGLDPQELERTGLLVAADGEETLDAIMDGAMPSPRLFEQVVGALIDSAAAASAGGRVRAFGEMVEILCRRGEQAAADALEELWNRLWARKSFSLLCGYRVDVFERGAHTGLLPQVYRAHSHVLPAHDAQRLGSAVERALVEVLGESDARKVYARVELQDDSARVPVAQLALMWVSAHMPRTAERVLAAARAHYLAAQPA